LALLAGRRPQSLSKVEDIFHRHGLHGRNAKEDEGTITQEKTIRLIKNVVTVQAGKQKA
jgi:tetrahydromethanopterin S-methyltransferase subunit F